MTDVTPRFPLNTIQPGAYSLLDPSALSSAEGVAGAPVVAVLGDCAGGKPNTALPFTRQQTLKTALRSGPAFDTARAALIGGAQRVIVVRVGNAIAQASKALAGTTVTPVTLTAIDYGSWTNNIKVTVAAANKVTVSFTDAFGTTYNEVFDCGAAATAQDVADAINGKKPNISGSAYVTATVGAGTMPLTVAAITNLAGGADTGAIVTGDWTAGLLPLETEDVSLVVAATGDATVHAQVLTHCNALSVPSARRERTTIAGGLPGEDVPTTVTRMTALRDKRAQLVYPGVTLFDVNGVATAYAPFVAAGYIAGKHAGLPDPATSLTHADVEILDVAKRLSQIPGGDVDVLLAAGVSPIAPTPGGGFWLVDSLSGYTADGSFRDLHKIRTADEVARRLRTVLEGKFVGGKTLNGTADAIRIAAVSELEDQLTEQLIRAFVRDQVAAVANPADPRTYLVACPVMLPDTTKFILLTIALQPASTAVAGTA